MTITTTQKVIKIGTSKGVTLPAKELERLGVDAGDEIKVTIEAIESPREIENEYAAFKQQYRQTLKNLAER